MKYKDIVKGILADRSKRELVDGAFWFLKNTKQISSDYTLPYEEICSQLADCRLAVYRDIYQRIDSNSY
jgi:hypothetical protein